MQSHSNKPSRLALTAIVIVVIGFADGGGDSGGDLEIVHADVIADDRI